MFQDTYAQMRDDLSAPRDRVSERRGRGKATPQRIRERLVRCIWYEGLFQSDSLRLDDGRGVRANARGWWNLGPGPDFNRAEIVLDGKTETGDIEIHTYSSDWYKHNHNQDPAYNNTVLHVIMWNDRDSKSVKRYDGSELPQLTLSRYLTEPLARLEEIIDMTEYPFESEAAAGLCRRKLGEAGRDEDRVGVFLDLAGDWRMLTKASRFGAMLRVAEPDEVLYRGLMEAMGYPVNKAPFGRLAEMVTARDLRAACVGDNLSRSFLNAQALLLTRGGLSPTPDEIRDDETRAYAAALASVERPHRESLARQDWRFGRMRPQNYPFRRAAAVALLYAATAPRNLFREILRIVTLTSSPKGAARLVGNMLLQPNEADARGTARYWFHRNTYTGKRSANPQRLWSQSLVRNVTVNIIVPVYLAFARKTDDRELESNLHRLYAFLPKLPPTGITRFMHCRIFGEEKRRTLVNSARRQQALYQIFRDYCEADDAGCERCAFLHALETKE